MAEESSGNFRILDCVASDHTYLHRDFHGALCYAIKYLDETLGPIATEEYLRQVGKSVFKPLITQLRQEGLAALEKQWNRVFSLEGGEFHMGREGEVLVLRVRRCPAIEHLKRTNQLFTHRFCMSTVVVNRTVCSEAGYSCSCKYESGAGACIQKFWKIGG
jgi:hypothetical protein